MRVWSRNWLTDKNKLTAEEKSAEKEKSADENKLIEVWSNISENCFSSYWISTVMKIWWVVRFMILYTVIEFHM